MTNIKATWKTEYYKFDTTSDATSNATSDANEESPTKCSKCEKQPNILDSLFKLIYDDIATARIDDFNVYISSAQLHS